MDIKQLKYFKAIVEEGTISGAAKVLNMTQPPLSYQMKMLEEELQASLFCRGTKKITLTRAGKLLYARTTALLAMVDITKSEVTRASQVQTIHIGLTPSTVSLMAGKLALFSKAHPEIHFDIHEGSTFALKEQIENRVIDVTTLRTPITLNGYEKKTLVKEELQAMAASKVSGLFKTVGESKQSGEIVKQISLSELAECRLILARRYREYVLNVFEKHEMSCDVYCECEDARTAMTLAEQEMGVAILPKSMRELAPQTYSFEIKDVKLMTEVLLVWRDENVSAEGRKFIEEICLGERMTPAS